MACFKRLVLIAVATLASSTAEAGPAYVRPYEAGTGFVPANAIDVCVLAELKKRGVTPSHPCSDAVFLRRVYVDVLGMTPDPATAARFLTDDDPERRTKLIDALLEHEAFADYWALKWCDLLRVKAEFPINLWPNGVQAYYRWIHDAVRENWSYDRFVRALLTSSGSNFRIPPVNFYRAVQTRTPDALAGAVALTFMGVRIEQWPEARRQGMAAFFSRLAYKQTAEWKEEVVILDPAPHGPLEAVFPDGTPVTIADDEDPRRVFADWLIESKNPWFVRNIANRVWSWLMGRGVIHAPDDIRDDNPPTNAALLACLERTLVGSDLDLKSLFRLILRSRTYQGSCIPQTPGERAEALFAHYAVRRLDAEVLIDALCRIDGTGEDYLSQVPEPFTILRGVQRSIRLSDGSITSPFLEMFGRPSRDTGLESERSNESTDAQRLHLLNSTDVNRRIARSRWLRRLAVQYRSERASLIRKIYLALLSRYPLPHELASAAKHFEGQGKNLHAPACDLAWALINSKEFLFRH